MSGPDRGSGRVTGIGGIFFRCADPDGVREWYARHLGLRAREGGGIWFEWTELETGALGRTVIGAFPDTTDYFDPGRLPFMVDYRVDDLEALLRSLRQADERVLPDTVETEDGRFGWVLDPDGQKVELWEPSPADGAGVSTGLDVTGLGGVFFRSPDPAALKAWYAERLGIRPGPDGYVSFRWREPDGSTGHLSWEVFPQHTDYFGPGGRPYMLNLRVRDLAALRSRLLEEGTVEVDPAVESYDYGEFGWVTDPTGARIELWEPSDEAFGSSGDPAPTA